VPFEPQKAPLRDGVLLVFCGIVGAAIVGMLAIAIWASFITYWPYNLSLTLRNYDFANFDASGWAAYRNSLMMAVTAATLGTAVVVAGAWLTEKTRGAGLLRGAVHLLAMLPLAVPGLVLVNARGNPLGFLYGSILLLALNTVAHFYTVAHLTALQALKQMDPEFESVSASLKVSVWSTFARVTLPVIAPAVLDVWIYLFVNAMTTVSAVVFLYGPFTKLASVSIVNVEEAGFTAAAAALGCVIVATSAAAKLVQALLSAALLKRTQAWRNR
jgi:iron(III) transport system permease protein